MKLLRELNLKLTKEAISKSSTEDIVIIQTVRSIDEISGSIDRLTKNLKERYGYYSPRASNIDEVDKFLEVVLSKKKGEMGVDFKEDDLVAMVKVVEEIKNLIKAKQEQLSYLNKKMNTICPNLLQIAGDYIGARLVELAGSLKHLAELPTSTIQILGSEKALFRHLKTHAKPPKFGIIYLHKEISIAKEKGKAARKLASKISMAVKKDYFIK